MLGVNLGLESNPGGVDDSQPLSTMETGDKHQSQAPNGTEKDLDLFVY